MFKKLLSNLPFNPSLLGQVNFYTQRLKKETFVRGVGLVTLALALVIQTFAVISPPQSSLAESTNDIIRGGFTSRDQAVLYCLDGNKDIHFVFEYYGLTCDIIANAQTVYIKSSSDDYHSLGRNPAANPSPRNNKNWAVYQVAVPGVSDPLWMKDLQYWDSGASSTYKVLKMTNKDGQTIYIMYSCGNIVTIGNYSPAPAPAPTPTPTPAPTPVTVIKDSCPNVAGTQTSLTQCDVCPDVPGTQTTAAQCDVCPKIPGSQTTKAQCDVCPNIPGEQTAQNQCYPCPNAQTNTTTIACLEFDKTGSNHTKGVENANNTTASANNIINYTLTVKNTGKVDFKDFVFDENLNDVLEYADMNDFGGGTLTSNRHLVWPARSIPANSSIKVSFGVRVKPTIPTTPISSSDPGSYDLCMTNVFYGKSITVCVKPPISKQIEVVSTSLPKTGPGESIIISLVVIGLMGYFYARNKLMVEELTIIRDEFSAGGMS